MSGKEYIQKNYLILRQNTSNLKDLCAFFVENGTLNLNEIDIIQNPFVNPSRDDRNENLYQILMIKEVSIELLNQAFQKSGNFQFLEKSKCSSEMVPAGPSREIMNKGTSRSPYYETDEIIREEIILGRGAFGIIYKGKLTDGNVEIALKLLIKRNEAVIREFSEEHEKEIGILLKARHKNVVEFLGVVKMYIGERNIKFVIEKIDFLNVANGNARDFVKNIETSKELLLEISDGIASGMAYLHENGIIHRDLAARNILIDAKYQAKISDFGLSKIIDEDHDHYTITDSTIIQYRWMPRECLKPGDQFSKSTDIWSFGVALWEIWNKGKVPYTNLNNEEVKSALGVGKNPMSFEIPEGIPEGIKRVLDGIFVEEELRPSFARIKILLDDIRKGNGNLSKEIKRDCPENQNKKRMEGQRSNSEENEFFTAKSTNLPEDVASEPPEINLAEIKIMEVDFKLDADNIDILSSLKQNYTVNVLKCDNISANNIPEITKKFKAIQGLHFWHTMDKFRTCKYSSGGDGSEDCIFKLPQMNPLENLKWLLIRNLELNTGDLNIGHENLPKLERLYIDGCDIRGNLVEAIAPRLFELDEISLGGNTPLLEKKDVEGLLGMKSLRYIRLSKMGDRQVISGSFSPIGPDGQYLGKITQNAEIEFRRYSKHWKMAVTLWLNDIPLQK